MRAQEAWTEHPAVLFKIIFQREDGGIGSREIKAIDSIHAVFYMGMDLREEFPDERVYFLEVLSL